MKQETSIPIPPSANKLWRIFGSGMHKSKHYHEWLDHCGWLARQSMRPVGEAEYPVRVTVTIRGGKGWRSDRDIDNTLKPCIDLLRQCGVLKEDSTAYVAEVTARFLGATSKKAEAECVVSVSTFDEVGA